MKRAIASLIFSFFFFHFPFNVVHASQQNVNCEVNWKKPRVLSQAEQTTLKVLNFEGANYDFTQHEFPIFSKLVQVASNSTEASVLVVQPQYVSLTSEEISVLEGKKPLAKMERPKTRIVRERGRSYALVQLIPVRKNPVNKRWEKLVSFTLAVSAKKMPIQKSFTLKSYTENSALASGEWYKLGVTEDGVYKVDYAFLQNLGIEMEGLSPDAINIFGNGFGLLPMENANPRPDDLQKNAIVIAGDDDGVFNEGDYILFYANGPDRWDWDEDGQRFKHVKHLYCDTAYYFIGINAGTPKRVGTIDGVDEAVTHSVSDFDAHAFHENDWSNLIKSGRKFYGELFDIVTTYNFGFSLPNIQTASEVQIRTNLVGRTIGTSNTSSFQVGVSGLASESIDIQGVSTSVGSPFGRESAVDLSFLPTASNFSVAISFNKNSATSQGWLDYIEVNARRNLTMLGSQLPFRDQSSVGEDNVAEYILANATTVQAIWEVTDPVNVQSVNFDLVDGSATFRLAADSLREFIAFAPNGYKTPEPFGAVANQNIHSMEQVDMVIVAHPLFWEEAIDLAAFHESDGLTVATFTPQQVYNEFSSGMRDITAIKGLMKMLYDRADGQEELMPDYLLLFGDGSYKNNTVTGGNSNYIPTYQSLNSLGLIGSYVSDDYYGLLDDDEGEATTDLIDIGIGRFPVSTKQQAQEVVSKIKRYASSMALNASGDFVCADGTVSGSQDWVNRILFVADDEDSNLHMNQANQLTDQVYGIDPRFNLDKIFLDAYQQEIAAGGQTYPEVNDLLKRSVEKGALIVNYTGHGGEIGWAQERILEVSTILNWENINNLPLFVTATCEFSRFDDPDRTSAGEHVLLNANGGGIGLLTTTRLVFASQNFELNQNFYDHLFDKVDNEYMRLGDISRLTKVASAGPSTNHRNFTLLGDPALRLRFPQYNVITDSINHQAVTEMDTLEALSVVHVSGHLEDLDGQPLNDFNGVITPTVFDKAVEITTLSNDGGSPFQFEARNNVIYRGKATVTNGSFSFEFVVPLDIAYQVGSGRMSYYAVSQDGEQDANGASEDFLVGGSADGSVTDENGPNLEIYLNDEGFVFGGLTDESPILLADVFDESGVNTVGSGIGHDITAVLDENTSQSIVLNDYYESDLDTYKSGKVRYQFSNLSEGNHSLSLKVWDVFNNSSQAHTEFVVATSEELALEHVLNYPNPFTTQTAFMFEHNQACAYLDVQVQVFTVSGKLVKTINTLAKTEGYRVEPIYWNGRDDFGDRLGRGVYIYRVKVASEEGGREEKLEKLVILN